MSRSRDPDPGLVRHGKLTRWFWLRWFAYAGVHPNLIPAAAGPWTPGATAQPSPICRVSRYSLLSLRRLLAL